MDYSPDTNSYTSRRSTIYSPNGVVATSQPIAAESGLETLRNGGNAFDAAVATAAVLNVVEPMSTGLGGDMFALYRTADGNVGAFRSCGGAAENATVDGTREAIAEMGADPSDGMPERGPLSVTVPGAPRGWEAVVSELGQLSMKTVLDDAIAYAQDGFPVTEVIASMWKDNSAALRGSTATDTYLINGKRAPQAGEQIKNKPLADTLMTLAEYGADPFYEGEIAEQIVETVQSRGGLLQLSDLEDFRPEFIDPISTSYNDATVYELPPNNQGLIAVEALNIAKELGCSSDSLGRAEHTHRLIEAMKLAFTDGHRHITDPDYESVPDLAAPKHATQRAATVGQTAIDDAEPRIFDSPAEDSDTVLLTVADNKGNVVSFINSIFREFGSGLVPESTGITLQNRGASFSLDPAHPNSIAPGKRPFHTLIPGLVQFDDADWAAFGVMGGYMQPQGHLQVLTNILDRKMSLQAALDEPRWRYMSDGSLAVEPRFDPDCITNLARRGHDITIELPIEFGGGQIARNRNETLSGATEPRKDGTVAGF